MRPTSSGAASDFIGMVGAIRDGDTGLAIGRGVSGVGGTIAGAAALVGSAAWTGVGALVVIAGLGIAYFCRKSEERRLLESFGAYVP